MAQSEQGNHSIAILKVPEHYDDVANGLKDFIAEITKLNSIQVDNYSFDIEYFLGGDWKFLAMCAGIDCAISEYACIWCKCAMSERSDLEKSWSITDQSKGARTIKEISDLAKCKKTKTCKNFNCSRQPLFPMIPIDHVIIDTLHLFLRISDNLINLLILELRRQDFIDKITTFTSGFQRSKYKHMASYERFLNDTCGIGFTWYICKDSKKLKWRDLTGPEKKKLISMMNISKLLPNFQKADIIQEIWNGFQSIMDDIRVLTNEKVKLDEFDVKLKKWMEKFLSVYQTKHVTPYMHALFSHVSEFVALHGNIVAFTQQGLEKLNDITTKNYFRASNQRNTEALEQILQKNNRMEYYKDSGFVRQKLCFTCSNCGESGHNIKTCLDPCNNCAFSPCCSPSHLVKTSGVWNKKCHMNNSQ